MTLQDYILESLQNVINEGGSEDSKKFNYKNISLNITDYINKFREYFNEHIKDDDFLDVSEDVSKFYYAPWTNAGWERLMGKSFDDGDGIVKQKVKDLDIDVKEFIELIIHNGVEEKLLYSLSEDQMSKQELTEEEIEKIKKDLTQDNIISQEALEEHYSNTTKKDVLAEMIYDYEKPLVITLSEEEYKKISKGKSFESFTDNSSNLILEGNKEGKTYYEYFNIPNPFDVKQAPTENGGNNKEGNNKENSKEENKIICFVIDENHRQKMLDDEIRQVNHRVLFTALMKYYIMICEKFTKNDYHKDIKNIVDNIEAIGSINGLYLLFFAMTMRYNDTINKGEKIFEEDDAVMKFVGKEVKDEIIRDFCIIALAIATMFESNFVSEEVSKLINLTGLLSEK